MTLFESHVVLQDSWMHGGFEEKLLWYVVGQDGDHRDCNNSNMENFKTSSHWFLLFVVSTTSIKVAPNGLPLYCLTWINDLYAFMIVDNVQKIEALLCIQQIKLIGTSLSFLFVFVMITIIREENHHHNELRMNLSIHTTKFGMNLQRGFVWGTNTKRWLPNYRRIKIIGIKLKLCSDTNAEIKRVDLVYVGNQQCCLWGKPCKVGAMETRRVTRSLTTLHNGIYNVI